MNKDVQSNIALAVSLLVGLGMLWSKMVEVWGLRKSKKDVDVTTITGKEIDDEAAWRKDILAENINLRLELREANKALNDGNARCTERISEILGKMLDISQRIQKVVENADTNTNKES